MAQQRLSTIERLDRYIEVEFSSIDTERFADGIDRLDAGDTHSILSWLKKIASTQCELAHPSVHNVLPATRAGGSAYP